MIYDIERIVNICAKRQINTNQLLYMYMIYKEEWALLMKLVNEIKPIEGKLDLEDLVNRKYLINWSGEWNNQLKDNFVVTDKFKHLLFVDTNEAGEQLFSIYPKWISIEGRSIPSTQGGDYKGRYFGKDEIIELYCKKISHDYEQHEKNLIGIRKAIKHNISFPILRKYVFDEIWNSFNDLEELEEREIKVI